MQRHTIAILNLHERLARLHPYDYGDTGDAIRVRAVFEFESRNAIRPLYVSVDFSAVRMDAQGKDTTVEYPQLKYSKIEIRSAPSVLPHLL